MWAEPCFRRSCQSQKYYASAIRDPVWLASELYTKPLISQETGEDVLTTQGTSMRQKVTFLLNCVDGKLTAERKPKLLLRFCDVLEKQRTLKVWARRMRATWREWRISSNTSVSQRLMYWSPPLTGLQNLPGKWI